MATIKYQIVRPDKLLHEGDASKIVLVTRSGELGVLPHHSREIVALGEGVMRIHHDADEDGVTCNHIVIAGGYAEITGELVIVLADHARDVSDIEPDVVEATRREAEEQRDLLPKGDSRRAYYESKIQWCDLLDEEHRKWGNL